MLQSLCFSFFPPSAFPVSFLALGVGPQLGWAPFRRGHTAEAWTAPVNIAVALLLMEGLWNWASHPRAGHACEKESEVVRFSQRGRPDGGAQAGGAFPSLPTATEFVSAPPATSTQQLNLRVREILLSPHIACLHRKISSQEPRRAVF